MRSKGYHEPSEGHYRPHRHPGRRSGKKVIRFPLAGKRASMNVTKQTSAFIRRFNKIGGVKRLKIKIGEKTGRLNYLVRHQELRASNRAEWDKSFRDTLGDLLEKTADYWGVLISAAKVQQIDPLIKKKDQQKWDGVIKELERLKKKELDIFKALDDDYLSG